jgi:CPA2 family monovalent cation:H+ antiporter-2
MDTIFLSEVLLILILSLFVLFVCNYLKIPLIIGYIVSGVVAGPFVLSLVGNEQIIGFFAEVGVIFLLFTIGIQFSLKSLFEAKNLVVLGGSLQMVLTTLCVMAAALFWGTSLPQAIFLGLLVSLSSTAIVMKVLQERGEVESMHGKTALSILIFQDLMLIPLMFITPVLAGSGTGEAPSFLLLLSGGIAVLVLVIVSTRYIVPTLLYYSAKVKSQEIFLLSVVAICFSIAWLISQTGISLALGAFIAGLMISESEFSVTALSHIMPFRDIFTGFFFISIGMLLDVAFFIENPLIILGLAAGIILLKSFTGTIATVFLNLPRRTSILTGLALCQIGEFTFILAIAGQSYGLLSGTLYQMILDVTLVTMVATPFVMGASHRITTRITDRLEPIMGPSCGFDLTRAPATADHIIIVGYGLNGRNVARAARIADIPYRIIEINPDLVRTECDAGEPIFYGDATQAAVLDLAGVREARMIVVVIADRIATQQVVQSARSLHPGIHILVRTRFVSEVPLLTNLGADVVIPEEFETSIEIFARALQTYHIPRDDIERLVRQIRAENYQMFRGLTPPPLAIHGSGVHLPGVDVASFFITGTNPLSGRRLAEVPWREEWGVSVIAVQRGSENLLDPGGDLVIQENDLVMVAGSAEAIRVFNQETALHPGEG